MKFTILLASSVFLAVASVASATESTSVCQGKSKTKTITLDGSSLVVMPTQIAQGNLSSIRDNSDLTEILTEDFNGELRRGLSDGENSKLRLFSEAGDAGIGAKLQLKVLSSAVLSNKTSEEACVDSGIQGRRTVTETTRKKSVQLTFTGSSDAAETVSITCYAYSAGPCKK